MSPLVGILVGSKSDLPVMEKCTKRLEDLGIEYELEVRSAHRNPEAVAEYVASAPGRGIKIFIHARGEPVMQNAIKPGHPFGYLDTEILYPDGTQLMIGFGRDAEACDATDLMAVQRQLDEILPGYEARDRAYFG